MTHTRLRYSSYWHNCEEERNGSGSVIWRSSCDAESFWQKSDFGAKLSIVRRSTNNEWRQRAVKIPRINTPVESQKFNLISQQQFSSVGFDHGRVAVTTALLFCRLELPVRSRSTILKFTLTGSRDRRKTATFKWKLNVGFAHES